MPLSFRTHLGDLEDSSCFSSLPHGLPGWVKGMMLGGRVLVNLATLCAPGLRSGLPAVPVTRCCVRVNGSWKSDLHKIAPELLEY